MACAAPGGNSDGKWLEHLKNFVTLAHQASYIAAEANFEAQRDFLQKIVSNLKLFNRTLIISYTSDFKFMAENRHLEMGSLIVKPRGNLSVCTGRLLINTSGAPSS